MRVPERVTPEKIYWRSKAGALLCVCAYEDEPRFRQMHLEGAVSLNEFQAKLPELRRDQGIIFY